MYLQICGSATDFFRSEDAVVSGGIVDVIKRSMEKVNVDYLL